MSTPGALLGSMRQVVVELTGDLDIGAAVAAHLRMLACDLTVGRQLVLDLRRLNVD